MSGGLRTGAIIAMEAGEFAPALPGHASERMEV